MKKITFVEILIVSFMIVLFFYLKWCGRFTNGTLNGGAESNTPILGLIYMVMIFSGIYCIYKFITYKKR